MQNKSKLRSCKWEIFHIMLNISKIHRCFQYTLQFKNLDDKNITCKRLGNAPFYQEPRFVWYFGVIASPALMGCRREISVPLPVPVIKQQNWLWLSSLYVSHTGPFPFVLAGSKIMSSCIEAKPNSVRHKISYFQPACFWLKEQLPVSQRED